MIYAATFVEKLASRDDYEHGCDTDSVCTLAESIDITADSLTDLLAVISDRYGLDLGYVFLGDDGDSVPYFSTDRLENADGDEPTDREMELWKNGEIDLYLCDYTFMVETREVFPVLVNEFDALGIEVGR